MTLPTGTPADIAVARLPAPTTGPTTCRMLIGRALDMIANKWSVPIILALARARVGAGAGTDGGPELRFSALARAIPEITQKELTKQLRELEAAGLVGRRVHAEVPPRVEYWLTELGATIKPVLDRLAGWAASHGNEIEANRAAYAARRGREPNAPISARPPAA